MAEEKEKFDLFDPSLLEDQNFKEEEIDETVDSFAAPPPPPDGIYPVVLSIGKDYESDGFALRVRQDKSRFIVAKIVAKLDDPSAEYGYTFTTYITTITRNKTNDFVGVLKAIEFDDIPTRAKAVELAQKLSTALQAEPTCYIQGRWEASVKGEDDKYKVIKKGMKKFPQKEDGTYSHTFTDEATGEDVVAQFAITRFLTVEEAEEKLAKLA